MEHDTIQHPGTKVPVAYSNRSTAFSERFGSLIGRVTQPTNLYDALGQVLPWEHLHIGRSEDGTNCHT